MSRPSQTLRDGAAAIRELAEAAGGEWCYHGGELWRGGEEQRARLVAVDAGLDIDLRWDDVAAASPFAGDAWRTGDAAWAAFADPALGVALAEMVERLAAAHRFERNGTPTGRCSGCRRSWPCATTRAVLPICDAAVRARRIVRSSRPPEEK